MLSEIWLLFFLVVVGVGLSTGQGVITAVGGMGFLVGGVSWLWNRVSLEGVIYERTLSSQRAFLGEEITLSIAITNKKPVPLGWLKAEDDIPDAVQLVGGKLVPSGKPATHALAHSTSMAWYERVHWSYKLRPRSRGYYRIGPVSINSGDLFGLFNSQRREDKQVSLLVYPKVVPIDELLLPPARPLGDVKGSLRILEDLTRPMGVRDYLPGDPMKKVDWKATARHQSLQVRVFEPSVSHVAVVMLNVDTAPHLLGGYFPEQLERVVTAAASIASYAVDQGYMVGLFSNGTPILAERPLNIPPARNPHQLTAILEALATVGPITSGQMADVLARYAGRFPLGATLALVTATISEKLTESIDYLSREGHKLVVLYTGDETPPQIPARIALYEIGEYFAALESQN